MLDLGEIRGVRRRSRAEPLDRRVEVAVRQVDARDASTGRDERLGAREADPALRARDERDRPSSRHVGRAHRERDDRVDLDRHVERQVRHAD